MTHASNISVYESSIFKIIVGTQRKIFWAHQDALSKSPFFKSACEGSFRESTSREIVLKDDDPLLFHHVLDFLYTSAWSPEILWGSDGTISLKGRSNDKDVRTIECGRQAQLYCMADFYRLDEMMSQAVEKLKLLAPISMENLLAIASTTYERLPSSNEAFREFVRTEAYKLRISRFTPTEWFMDHVEEGGLLTQDLFMALQRTCERHVQSLEESGRDHDVYYACGRSGGGIYPSPEFYDESVDAEIPVVKGWRVPSVQKKKKKGRH